MTYLNKRSWLKQVLAMWNCAHMMVLGILNTVMPLAWQYLKYWWNGTEFLSAMVVFGKQIVYGLFNDNVVDKKVVSLYQYLRYWCRRGEIMFCNQITSNLEMCWINHNICTFGQNIVFKSNQMRLVSSCWRRLNKFTYLCMSFIPGVANTVNKPA